MSSPRRGSNKHNGAAPQPARFPWILLILGAAVFVTLLVLGHWQVQRLQWKEQLLATIDQRVHAAPKPLAEVEAEFIKTGTVDYLPVTVRGTLRNDKELFFFTTHNGASGYAVYTPLIMADNRAVLVNRGFVPYEMKDRATRPEKVTGEVTITGLARDPLLTKPSSYLPENDPAKNIYYWKDWAAMHAASGLALDHDFVGFFIDADAKSNPAQWPVGGITILDQPNNHLQYAATWYGLAAVLAVIMLIYLLRRRKIEVSSKR